MNISPQAQALIDLIKTCKGQFIRVKYKTNIKPAARHKGVVITKSVNGIFRTGIDYANKASVKDAIASGERGEVQTLSWGEWAVFPWIIAHKGAEYLRLYPVESVAPEATYEITDPNRAEGFNADHPATKEEVAQYLTPAEADKILAKDKPKPECITKKIGDLEVVGCWHNEVSDDRIEQEANL